MTIESLFHLSVDGGGFKFGIFITERWSIVLAHFCLQHIYVHICGIDFIAVGKIGPYKRFDIWPALCVLMLWILLACEPVDFPTYSILEGA